MDISVYESISLEFPEGLGEHLIRDIAQVFFELAVAGDSMVIELPEDQDLPLASEGIHHKVDGATERAVSDLIGRFSAY